MTFIKNSNSNFKYLKLYPYIMCLFLQHGNCIECLTILNFSKLLLYSPEYFFVFDIHTVINHNIFLYTYILDGAGMEAPWRR